MKCDCASCSTHVCYTKGIDCTGVYNVDVNSAYSE